MTVLCTMGPRGGSTKEVEGFLLSSLNLKIKAEPSFFCPLTGQGSTFVHVCPANSVVLGASLHEQCRGTPGIDKGTRHGAHPPATESSVSLEQIS